MASEELLFWLILNVFLAGLVGWFGESRGHPLSSGFLWSLVLSAPIGFVIVLFMGKKEVPAHIQAPPSRTLCGRCGKPLSPFWKVECKHCGARYDQVPPVAA